jgi:hypothetical protein
VQQPTGAVKYYQDTIVNGSTEIDIDVPYLSSYDWYSSGKDEAFQKPVIILPGVLTDGKGAKPLANITVTVEQFQKSTGDKTPKFLCVVIMKPMDDFQVRHWYPRKFSQSRVLDAKFRDTGIVEGGSVYKRYPVDEDMCTFEDLTRKWSYTQRTNTAGTFPYGHWFDQAYFSLGTDLNLQMPNDVYLVNMFYFSRGGFDVKITGTPDVGSVLYVTSQLPQIADVPVSIIQPYLNNGAIVRDTDYNKVVDGTFVAEGITEWFWTTPNNDVKYESAVPISLYCNIKASTDFSLYSRGAKTVQLALLQPPYLPQYAPWYLGYASA